MKTDDGISFDAPPKLHTVTKSLIRFLNAKISWSKFYKGKESILGFVQKVNNIQRSEF